MRLFKRCGCAKTYWLTCPHNYYFSFKLNGKKEKECAGFPRITEAERHARKRRAEIEELGGRLPKGSLRVMWLMRIDLRRIREKNCRKAREQDIRETWRPIIKHLGGTTLVADLKTADIEAYRVKRRADAFRAKQQRLGAHRPTSGQTLRKEQQALMRTIKRAVRDHRLLQDPISWDALDTIKSDPKDAKQSSKGWLDHEVAAVLDKLSAKAKTLGLKDKLRFIQLTGLRAHELPRYDRTTWLRPPNELHIPAIGKNGKPRVVYLGEEALAIASRHQSFKLGKPNKALKAASIRAGFTDRVLTPRDLRASFISKIARQNVPAAARLAGHSNIATTSRYAHIGENEIRELSINASGGPTKGPTLDNEMGKG